MHPPLPHQSVTPPQPRPPSSEGTRQASNPPPRRSQGLIVDFGPVVPQPIPDWDWPAEDERRRN